MSTPSEEESLAKPEALNSGAISVINRVSAKLTGRDFRPASKKPSTSATSKFADFSPTLASSNLESAAPAPTAEWPLSVHSQVDRLIGEASRIENLCQAYVGW